MARRDGSPREKLISCSCGSPEHQFILTYWPGYGGDEDELYMEPHLITWENIFRRLWTAIRYVFGYRCKYGHWDCVLISKDKAQEMRGFLDEFIGVVDDASAP